ncbi:hypothetical protein ROBYS_25620 [Roseobacter sp. OBYS 0001]|nr:hypothetical protein ROBYS_25620 [Roseobacter sp. OBYS 0001]
MAGRAGEKPLFRGSNRVWQDIFGPIPSFMAGLSICDHLIQATPYIGTAKRDTLCVYDIVSGQKL